MANILIDVTPKLIAAAVPVLRRNSVMPRLVNTNISAQAAEQGATVDVPIPHDFVVQPVVASHIIAAPQDMTLQTVPVPLDEWHYVPFHLTDQEMVEIVDNNVIPTQFEAMIKALADFVDDFLLGLYVEFFGYFGVPGQTPFSNGELADGTGIRKILNDQLAPMDPRHVVMDTAADAAALALTAFANAEWHGDPTAILKGRLNERLGFQWWMNQGVKTHTTGAASGWLQSGGASVDDTLIPITGGSGNFNVGDLVHFANHTQSYVVTSTVNTVSITIRPPLQDAVPDTTVITSVASHVANLAFHPQAFAFAVRPLAHVQDGLGVITQVLTDTDVSGLSIRLQVRYQHYMTIWSGDILFGGAVVRPELGARFLG